MAFVIDKVRGKLGPSKASRDDNDCLDSKTAAREAKKSLIARLEQARAELEKETDEKRREKLKGIVKSLEIMKRVEDSRS